MFGSYPYPPNILYTPCYEDILVLKKKGKSDLSNKSELSKISKQEWIDYTMNIWEMPRVFNKEHTAMFPEELPSRAIKLHSFVNDIVLDPFAGSGTTCVAAKKLKRHYIGIDISQKYCDIANKRLKNIPDKKIDEW